MRNEEDKISEYKKRLRRLGIDYHLIEDILLNVKQWSLRHTIVARLKTIGRSLHKRDVLMKYVGQWIDFNVVRSEVGFAPRQAKRRLEILFRVEIKPMRDGKRVYKAIKLIEPIDSNNFFIF